MILAEIIVQFQIKNIFHSAKSMLTRFRGTAGTAMRTHITEAAIKALKPSDRDQFLFDTRLAGFGYRLTPAGTGVYFVGKPRCNFRAPSPAAAREQARQMLADIAGGCDPKAKLKTRRQAALAGAMTIRDLADRWMTLHVRAKLKPRTIADYEKLLARHILPTLGHLTVTGISRADVIALHVAMKATPRRANYTIRTVQGMMTFACDTGLRPLHDNPVRKLKLYREQKRERFLDEAEIAKAADAITKAERAGVIGPHAAAGLRLCLFSGARSGEIAAAKWSHVDFGRRFIRLPDSKTGDARTIHLSDAALEVLKTLPRVQPYIVAGALPGQALRSLSRSWIVARRFVDGLDDVRLHDLRHSYASLAAGRGVSLRMIGELLGHKVPATTMRYAHLARDAAAAVNDELGQAMTAAIEKGTTPDATIVKLPRRKRR
jgi:integrase